jgi:hypothetical protein
MISIGSVVCDDVAYYDVSYCLSSSFVMPYVYLCLYLYLYLYIIFSVCAQRPKRMFTAYHITFSHPFYGQAHTSIIYLMHMLFCDQIPMFFIQMGFHILVQLLCARYNSSYWIPQEELLGKILMVLHFLISK